MSTPFQLIVPRSIYDDMIAQARSELPNECCGILAGRIRGNSDALLGEVAQCYALVNAARSPTEFLSEPKSMFEAERDKRQRGIEFLAIYHSHPTSAPVPSRKDLEQNYSPDLMNLIISLKDDTPEIRGWWLEEHNFREADWRLLE